MSTRFACHKAIRTAACLLALGLTAWPAGPVSANYANFESHQIHPVVLSPDGTRLFALNTPDGYLVVYHFVNDHPLILAQIPVGLEPVSIAWRNANEVWVVNTLSDNISIVDLTTNNVRKTLQVGDEPFDVIFAGTPERAFVSVSQEDVVKVYDPNNLSTPPVVIPIFGSDPKALAKSPDGSKVYCAVFESGNRSTCLPESTVTANGGLPPPTPPMAGGLPPAPATGLIVQFNGTQWLDETGGDWTSFVPYTMPDNDIAVIDANAPTPSVLQYYNGVGTLNYDLTVNPNTGKIFVSNADAQNLVRFEPKLNGSFYRQRITIIDPAGPTVTPVHLNPHINYSVTPGPQAEIDQSLSTPMAMAWNQSGTAFYMTALGSGKVAVVDQNGVVLSRWEAGEGPTGIAFDKNRNRLYVLDRFQNNIKIISTTTGSIVALAGLGFNPEPPEVRNGRKFLYAANLTSGHGDVSCSSCHAFANNDHEGWDLGDPTGSFLPPPAGQSDTLLTGFHPMKGPFMTQTLRGLQFTEPFHTRGDRTDFFEFNVAFTGLMGRGSPLSGQDLLQFNDFIMTVQYPPNPNIRLDNTLRNPALEPSAQRGKNAFTSVHLDDGKFCVECHEFPFGTNGQITSAQVMGNEQDLDMPQLRNMYEKTGFSKTGATKSGFGFIHNGTFPTLFEFFQEPFFTFGANNVLRRDMEAFMLAWDTGTAPAVGAQVTFDAANKNIPAVVARLDTLIGQANLSNCDLIVKGVTGGLQRGYRYVGSNMFQPDRAAEAQVHKDTLRSWADTGAELTASGVPVGCGIRAIDRDGDGFLDRDELDAGSDPADPNSTPSTSAAIGGPDNQELLGGLVRFFRAAPNPTRGSPSRIEFALNRPSEVTLRIYDPLGRLVQTMFDRELLEGEVNVVWDLTNERGVRVPTGVYFYRLSSDRFVETRRLTVLR